MPARIRRSHAVADHSNLLGNFPTDASLIAEMEFYLISDLDYHLMIWHPYRSALSLPWTERS